MFETLGEFMRLARQRRGLSQEEAAKLAQVSRWQLVRMEQGSNISLNFLIKVAGVLELTDIPVEFVTLRKPDIGALLMAAEAIDVARKALGTLRGADGSLDRAAEMIQTVLVKPEVPVDSHRRVERAASRLAATAPNDSAAVGRALRASAESSLRPARRATTKTAAGSSGRRRAR